MSDHLQSAIDQLEVELEAIDQKRGDIEHAIGALTRLKREGLTTNGDGTGGTKSSKRSKPDTAVKRGRPAAATTGSLNETQERLLVALRKRSPVSPGELAAAVKLDVSAARYHLKGLEKQGLVEFSGKTLDRQVRLTHKGGASKEHL